MGLWRDIRDVQKANKEIIFAKMNEEKKELNIFDYTAIGNGINRKGFLEMGITFQDILELNEKYDLRWSGEEISNAMNSEEPYTNLMDLPMPHKVYFGFSKDLYVLYSMRTGRGVKCY